jgi:hypothetical protein
VLNALHKIAASSIAILLFSNHINQQYSDPELFLSIFSQVLTNITGALFSKMVTPM